MGGFVCAAHRRKNKGFPTLKRTLYLGIEKGRLLKNSRPKGGLIQVICYPTSPETVDITGFFEKFCIAIRTKKKDMTFGHVFLFGFQPPKAASTLRYLNARGRQSRPCAKVFPCGENACAAHSRRGPEGPFGGSSAIVSSIQNIDFNRPFHKNSHTCRVWLFLW